MLIQFQGNKKTVYFVINFINMKKLLIIFFVALIFASCKTEFETRYFKFTGNTQGTTYSIIFEGDTSTLSKIEIDNLLHQFDLSLSTYVESSIISKINQGDTTVFIDKYFKDMFNKADEVNKTTNGAFDITVAPLVNAYGFGFTEDTLNIDSTLIDSLLKYVGMGKVKIINDKIIKEKEGIMLDGNAIAQGQSVDVVCEYLEVKGIKNYLVEIGGEIKAKGKKASEDWLIGIDKPEENAANDGSQLHIKLINKAVATSGNYRKFYVKDGEKYTHSINPKTGYPSKQNILSATIFADNCMTADAYATACMVIGTEKSIELIKTHPELSAYIIFADENGEMKTFMSEGVKELIVKQ